MSFSIFTDLIKDFNFSELQKTFEKGFIPILSQNISHEEPNLNLKPIFDNIATRPKWAENNIETFYYYYNVHKEVRMDSSIRKIARILGIVIHGNFSQKQLESHLKSFDVKNLLEQKTKSAPILSEDAQTLLYKSLELEKVIDIHLHLFGMDKGNYLNPKAAAYDIANWEDYFKFSLLRYVAGITSPIGSTAEASKRLELYAQHFPKLQGMILPIHKAILPDGKVDWKNTGNFLKNRSALELAYHFSDSNSKLFSAVSVHPFDKKWESKLLKAYEKGIRLVKWMPPQSISPDSERLNAYYEFMQKHQMILIAHSGPEHALPTTEENKEWEDFGNPLQFRKPLEMGVNVILAHCGHHDFIPDLDHPERQLVPGYHLFLRLAKEAHGKNQSGEWSGKLYGDLAGITTHYGTKFIAELLKYANEEGIRLIYGSDYPYTNLIKPREDAYDLCAKATILDPNIVKPLKEIRSWNPLLANFVFTKNLELTDEMGKKYRFPESTFTGQFKNAELKLFDLKMWEESKLSALKK